MTITQTRKLSSLLILAASCSMILLGAGTVLGDSGDQKNNRHWWQEEQQQRQEKGERQHADKQQKQQPEQLQAESSNQQPQLRHDQRQPAEKVLVREKTIIKQPQPQKGFRQPVVKQQPQQQQPVQQRAERQNEQRQLRHAQRQPAGKVIVRENTVIRQPHQQRDRQEVYSQTRNGRSEIHTGSRPEQRHGVIGFRKVERIERPAVRPPAPRKEVIVRSLPRESRTLTFNRERYHTHNGHFYRQTPRGYLQVRPPLGAMIADLPFGFLRVSFGGLDYCLWDNVFYRHTPRGFMVVETPFGYQDTSYGPAQVEAGLLNIRSGPGRNYAVIGRLEQGEFIMVTAITPDWYYVLLPDGSYGWVMSRFTSLIAQG